MKKRRNSKYILALALKTFEQCPQAWRRGHRMRIYCHKNFRVILLLLILLLLSTKAHSATWYVDKDATGANNGTSWDNAFTSLSAVSTVAGDTVYISGGTTSKTYPATWSPAGGTPGNPVTYRVGQDAGHNGTVIIEGGNTIEMGIKPGSNIVINGNYNGLKHIKIQNVANIGIYTDNKSNLTFEYLVIDNAYDGITINYGTGYSISYCDITHITGDHGITFGGTTGATWDSNLVHHNYIQVGGNQDSAGYGADGIRWGPGTSFYNNTIESYKMNYGPTGQHQDGFQVSDEFVKIYNNIIKNMGNSAIFIDTFSPPKDVLIYNNVISIDVEAMTGYHRGIEIFHEGGVPGIWNNVRVYNNTIVDMPGYISIHLQTPKTTGINVEVKNNLIYKSNDIISDVTNAVIGNNFVNGWGTPQFLYYSTKNPKNNYSLLRTDTVAKDRGVALSSFFTNDILGVARPQGTAWDIGAYEYKVKTPMNPVIISIE